MNLSFFKHFPKMYFCAAERAAREGYFIVCESTNAIDFSNKKIKLFKNEPAKTYRLNPLVFILENRNIKFDNLKYIQNEVKINYLIANKFNVKISTIDLFHDIISENTSYEKSTNDEIEFAQEIAFYFRIELFNYFDNINNINYELICEKYPYILKLKPSELLQNRVRR